MLDTKSISNQSIKKIAPMAATAFVAAALVGAFSFTTTAWAAVSFDPESGTGFVGKGDVQTALGWNNKQLQDNAGNVQFRATSEVVTEVTWECTRFDRDGNPTDQSQEREQTTTTTIQGVVSKVDRERNQITGFTLTGYSGTPTETTDTDGPAVGTCPSGWRVTEGPSEPQEVSSTTTLEVRSGSGDWVAL